MPRSSKNSILASKQKKSASPIKKRNARTAALKQGKRAKGSVTKHHRAGTMPAKSTTHTTNSAKRQSKPGTTKAKTAKRGRRKRPVDQFEGGIYHTPKGNVSIGIPAFWTLRQTNDDLEVESPTGKTSVVVTAFQRDNGFAKLDAREYLNRFLQTAPVKGKPVGEESERAIARSRFRDLEGDSWRVAFLTDGDTLLLATLNSTLPSRNQEWRTGGGVLESITLT